MKTIMATTSTPLNEREQRALERSLDAVEKNLLRADMQFSRVRRHERQVFRAPIVIFLPPYPGAVPPNTAEGLIDGWAYSLSQGGMGFVSLDALLNGNVTIGLSLPNGQLRWMPGHIVRRREIPQERYIDYGLAFGTP